MPENEQTKVCPLCAETIKVAAKVCPHCRHWQKKWSLQNPQNMAAIWVLIMFGVFVGLGALVEKVFGPKRDFGIYRDQISVVSSEFNYHMVGSNWVVTVVGTLTNRSEFNWENVGVEAQCFDKSEKLIDVVSAVGDYRGLTMLSHSEAAFKIEGKAARPEADYAKHKAFVRWAKDVDTFF